MYVEFLQPQPVDLESVPVTAWGRLQVHVCSSPPSFVGGDAHLRVSGHMFRKGVRVDLPDELAREFVANGTAVETMRKDCEQDVVWLEGLQQ